MSCSTEGFPTLRHNDLRDFTAAVLIEVCSDVRFCCSLLQARPFNLQQLKNEDGACVDVLLQDSGNGNIRRLVLMFNANVPSYHGTQVSSLY